MENSYFSGVNTIELVGDWIFVLKSVIRLAGIEFWDGDPQPTVTGVGLGGFRARSAELGRLVEYRVWLDTPNHSFHFYIQYNKII